MAAPLRQAVVNQLGHPSSPNLGLVFDKCANTWNDGWNTGTDNDQTASPKQRFFQTVATSSISSQLPAGPSAVLLAAFHKRQKALRHHLVTRCWEVPEAKTLKTRWRFVTGMGISHPFENGLVFDRTMGVPFLPGSSVKGAAQRWAKDNNDAALQATFGDAGSIGAVVFFDAYPVTWPKLEVDIMNPHYGPYYQKQEPPGDWYSPVPVHFLAIAAGQAFCFAVAARPGANPDLAKRALAAIVGAATDQGLGGKSGVGYGYFDM